MERKPRKSYLRRSVERSALRLLREAIKRAVIILLLLAITMLLVQRPKWVVNAVRGIIGVVQVAETYF